MRWILMVVLLIGLVDISSSVSVKKLFKKLFLSGEPIQTDSNGDKTRKDQSDPLDFMNRYLTTAKEDFNRKWGNPVTCKDGVQSFKFIRELGSGSFGRVKLAKHKQTKTYYAIKKMSLREVARMQRSEPAFNANKEISISQAIDFPFLVKTKCSFKDNTNLYIVMEYVCGADLHRLVKRGKKFKERDAKFYAAQLVLALDYLHSMRLIHRDLKLRNVLIDKDGYIKVADFGFTQRLTGPTTEKCGTPKFRAPELILGKPYEESVDWWMFGTLLYRMSTGRVPFNLRNDDKSSEIYRYIVRGKVNYPSRLSPDLKDLLKHLLIKDPNNRYGLVDVIRHKWFDDIDWKDIYNKKATVPYIPKCPKLP